jgi:hypothetical protein
MSVHKFPPPQPRADTAPPAVAPKRDTPRPTFLGGSRTRYRHHYAHDNSDWGGVVIAAVVVGAFVALLVIGLHMTGAAP